MDTLLIVAPPNFKKVPVLLSEKILVAPARVGVTAFNGEVQDNSVLSKIPSLSSSRSIASYTPSPSVSAQAAKPLKVA